MSLKDELKCRGYDEISTQGKCKYYVKGGEKYAVAIAVRKGVEYPLIVENDVFKKLWYPSIFLDDKTRKGMLVPCIQLGVGHYERIHNLILPVQWDKHVDHINHCRFFCIKDNLRYCAPSENSMNSYKAVKIHNDEGGYQFQLTLQSNARHIIPTLEEQGFCMFDDTGTWFTVKSPHYSSRVDCYLAYRDTARAVYKGTRMEDFVYDIENDFSETIDLLISHYILGDITEEEMHKKNLDFWRDRLDNAPLCKR